VFTTVGEKFFISNIFLFGNSIGAEETFRKASPFGVDIKVCQCAIKLQDTEML